MSNRKKRHVPDVLFVDEEGNPIEAGHENLIYVDEQGNEIPEEIAQQLLESGKYIDSRDLYLAADTASVGGGATDTISNTGNQGTSSMGGQVQYDLTQPSLPASAFGSLSKSTGANEMTMTRKSSYQSLKSSAGEDEPRVASFAQAQAKMKQREDELREIEADAAIAAANAAIQQHSSHGLNNKSMSNTDMQKSHSGRRLLQPPPLKNSQDFKSQDSLVRKQQQQQPQPPNERPSSSQQVFIKSFISGCLDIFCNHLLPKVFELHQLINSNSSKEQDRQSHPSGVESSGDQMERVRSRQGRSSRKQRQPSQQQYMSDGGSYYEVAGAADQTDETGDDVQSQLTEQHILEMREQQMLREKLLRKQQEYLEQQEYARRRNQAVNPYDDEQTQQYLLQHAQQDDTAGEETGNGTDDEYFRQLSRNFTQSVGSTNMMSPRPAVGSHHRHHQHNHHQQHLNTNSTSSAAIVSTSAGSHMTPVSLTHATRDRLRSYLKGRSSRPI